MCLISRLYIPAKKTKKKGKKTKQKGNQTHCHIPDDYYYSIKYPRDNKNGADGNK
jgi:hypothetical protein